MASMTDYLEDKIRDHVLRNVPYTSPPAVFLALSSSATTDAGAITEPVGGSYARVELVVDPGGAGTGSADNPDEVRFVNMPAGTWTHGAIYDDDVGGNMLLHAALNAPKTTALGDDLAFAAGDVDAIFS